MEALPEDGPLAEGLGNGMFNPGWSSPPPKNRFNQFIVRLRGNLRDAERVHFVARVVTALACNTLCALFFGAFGAFCLTAGATKDESDDG